jgi:hypothetical protein
MSTEFYLDRSGSTRGRQFVDLSLETYAISSGPRLCIRLWFGSNCVYIDVPSTPTINAWIAEKSSTGHPPGEEVQSHETHIQAEDARQ